MSAFREFAGKWFVLKVGGELATDRALFAHSVGAAIAAFVNGGVKVALIHGAGPQATALTAKLGHEAKKIGGRRVTDEMTLEIMKMTLGGQVSVDIAAALRVARVRAICTTGVSAGLVEATRRPPTKITGAGPDPIDLGLVGDVVAVDVAAFERLHQGGFVPVIGSLSGDSSGNVFNINADTVATRVATALRAEKLFLISDVPGVLRDKDDPKTRIPTLYPDEARKQIADGVIQGGMIPKVEESLATLDSGVGSIHIVGIDPPDSILEEARAPGTRGTAFLRDA